GYPSSGGGFPPPGGFPPQKQGPNVGLIVGIIALIVVVVGGGLFWAYGRGGGGTTQVTPTPSSTTPTVAPTPTPAALFSDTFDDNHNNWDLGSSASYTISLSGGSLRLKEINPDKIVRAPFVQQPPTDATINMTFTLSTAGQNDMMGLLMRGSGASNLFGYYIDVYGDNSYDIQRYYQDPADSTKGKVEYLLDSTTTGIKPKGQENQMSVVIKGSSISLTVNGQFVKTVTDTSNSFPSGRTYFFVQSASTTNGVEGAFSSLDIYPAPANLPS
ncbi:MAG: hypothetical protein J2P37_17975, partial [Ktedonobacteraceae bacterium]|nr:hypothetical protein [Ktedonobacteraceae bacterium]